jgi:GT2 family glycosyltransferase
VEYVTGATMAIRRGAIERIGPMDEGFWPGYLEDVDYCLRARAAGFGVWYCSQAIYLHYESTSTDTATRSRYYQRGRLRLVLKHLPPERILAEFVPAERATLPVVMAGPANRPTRLAYLEVCQTCLRCSASSGR